MHTHARHIHAMHAHVRHTCTAHAHIMHADCALHPMHCTFYVKVNNGMSAVAVRLKTGFKKAACKLNS